MMITCCLVVCEIPGDEVAVGVSPLQFLIGPPRTIEPPENSLKLPENSFEPPQNNFEPHENHRSVCQVAD